ncbi:MAG: MlaD family protein [Candidatus Omnitrophica bacterium]|nr:MlaD family protein [Candidatus Omnitrophota bacterium]MDD5487650.1 MlaD family protein [Candidatus Omnitrophota bacterium]
MIRDDKLELKVGLFMGLGIFLMFFIVFSIGDIYKFEKGYTFNVVFDYVNGINKNSPVRYAGVDVGEVTGIAIYYDEQKQRTRVKLDVKVDEGTNIEVDAVPRINSLGLLGEQYLEISPGTGGSDLITQGTVMDGRNPVSVGQQMENMTEFISLSKDVMERVAAGEGTLGKFISDSTFYDDLTAISGRLRRGEGTIGRLLVEEKVYEDVSGFTGDIKANPWKLLHKTPDKRKRDK